MNELMEGINILNQTTINSSSDDLIKAKKYFEETACEIYRNNIVGSITIETDKNESITINIANTSEINFLIV